MDTWFHNHYDIYLNSSSYKKSRKVERLYSIITILLNTGLLKGMKGKYCIYLIYIAQFWKLITLQYLLLTHWPMCVVKKHTQTVFQFIHYVLWPSVQQGSISLFEDSKCQYWPTSFDVSSTFFYLIQFCFMWSNIFYFFKLRILTYTFECSLDKTR